MKIELVVKDGSVVARILVVKDEVDTRMVLGKSSPSRAEVIPRRQWREVA